jgi:hypothetical protein
MHLPKLILAAALITASAAHAQATVHPATRLWPILMTGFDPSNNTFSGTARISTSACGRVIYDVFLPFTGAANEDHAREKTKAEQAKIEGAVVRPHTSCQPIN